MYVSIRDWHLPMFGNMKAGLAELGLDAVEVEFHRDKTVMSLDGSTPGESLADDAATEAYGYKCKGFGIKPAAFLLNNNFGADDVAGEIDYVIAAVRAAGRLGIHAVRIDAIMQDNRGWDLARRTQHFSECMAKVLDATHKLDVGLGIENHGSLGNDPEFLDTILNKVNSPRVGITMDTANFYWFGHPLSKVRELIKQFAPRTKHTHMKSINYPVEKREVKREMGWDYGKYASSLREGDIDLKWVAKILTDAGYKGDLCIESEALGRYDRAKQKAILKDDASYLKEILAGLR